MISGCGLVEISRVLILLTICMYRSQMLLCQAICGGGRPHFRRISHIGAVRLWWWESHIGSGELVDEEKRTTIVREEMEN